MHPPENNDSENALRGKLEELESLLDEDVDNAAPQRIKVPVLDELVTAADFTDNEHDNDLEQIEEQITDLAEKLEQKLSGELDQLVGLLKNNLKNSIIEELRWQANLSHDASEADDGTLSGKGNNSESDTEGNI
jgi:hypothetical protein